jgi:RHS repeat-associated protein
MQRFVVLLALLIGLLPACNLPAYQFALSGIPFELQEVTTNLDVYFSAMRFNRVSNEWDVDFVVSNKSSATFSGPLLLLVDNFSGTTGPLRPDGVSTNKAFYDLTGQLPTGALNRAQRSTLRTLGLGFLAGQSPHIVTRLFAGTLSNGVSALGFTRSLNDAGQPVAGVSVVETGPNATSTNATDSVFGVVTLGQTPGSYTWKFSQPGYLSVWRQAILQSNAVTTIPYPWLAARDSVAFSISPLLGGVASNATATVQFAPGAVPQNATAHLTQLSGQTLPLFLPQGWSPLQALWLDMDVEPSQPLTATLVPWGAIGSSEAAALVQFVPASLSWQVLQLVAGSGTNGLSVVLPGSGVYALVVADGGPGTPPVVMVGSALGPGSLPLPDPAGLVASGTVTPANSPASLLPELVTGMADLVVSNAAGALPSGTLLRGEVSEHYLLSDGTSRVPPGFGDFVVAYRRPGSGQANVLHAQFPMRPLLLFGPDRLNEGLVHMDIFSSGTFSGGVLGTNGGLIASDGLRVLAGPGVLDSQQAAQLQRLDPTNFTDLAAPNFTVAAAFELSLSALPPGKELFFQSTGLPPNMTFVLARVLTDQGLYGLEPRARLHSDASGNLSSDEPATGPRLPGLAGAGEFVLLQVQPQQALVQGTALNTSGQPTAGLPVRVNGQPWLTFSAVDGGYKLLAPAGAGSLEVSNPNTGDSGNQAITVPVDLSPVSSSVALTVNGLRVASITPGDLATNVPLVSPVVVTFNRPINPGTALGNAVQLLGASNQPVAATLTLNLANTAATLLPNAPLDPATAFTVLLSTNIADSIGRPLQGQAQFTFTTVALPARDPAAQLIIYEPGATNLDTNVVSDLPGYTPGTNASLVVVHGTPGCADPNVPVIVANEGSSETTTVLSKEDGSFSTFVHGREQDFISATFVSLNGARLYIPVNRQLFDDGTVGLYQQGGALQAQGSGGPVSITVPPNALTGRSKFKLASIDVPGLETQLGGILPSNGVVAGSALNLNIQGPLPTLPLQVSFPVDLSQLDYPTNEEPTNAAAALTIVQTNQSVTAFQVVDQLFFHPQSAAAIRSKSHSVKGDARRPKGAGNPGAVAGALDTSVGLLISSLGPAGYLAQVGFNQVLVPMLFGPRPVTIKGSVGAVPYDIAYQLQMAGLANQIFNLQLGSLSGNQLLDVPLGLVQQMGIKYVPQNILQPISGTAGNIVGGFLALTLQALKLKEADLSLPISGAFVTVTTVGGGLNRVPGHLYPGMIYATSGANGSFLTVAPAAGFNYVVTCTHPLYQEVLAEPVAPINALPGQQGQLGLAGVVFQNFFFQLAATNTIQPSVSIANTPVRPAPGQTSQIIVNASQPSGTPTVGVHILNVGTNNLETGQVETNVHYNLANLATVPGPNNSVQWIGTLTADKPVDIVLKVDVIGQAVNQYATYPYHIAFTGPIPPTPISDIPAPDTNDVHGPLVAAIDPVYDGFIAENSSITVYFNKPIDSSVTNHLQGITLVPQGGGLGNVPNPIVQLSPSQTIMLIKYPGLSPGTTYQLSLSGQSIMDLGGKPLDQLPSTPAADHFTTVFRTPPSATANLPGMVNGRGCVISGNNLYVIDQAPQDNYLLVYDITSPLQPKLLSRTHLFGLPRDLVVVPQFRYVLDIHDRTIKTNDLVAVVGGNLDAVISDPNNTGSGTTVSTRGQYLWVLSMADPTSPQILASPIVSYRIGSAVCKVRWAPPYLVYQEFGADIQQLGLVNLQELIIGFNSTLTERAAFPDPAHRSSQNAGYDANGEGAYVDPGESLPIPDLAPAEFYGKHQSYVLQGGTQKILDFSVTPGARTVGVSLGLGVTLDANGNPLGPPLPPMYRTLVSAGFPLNIGVPTNAMLPFGQTAYPRWVCVLQGTAVQINDSITTLNLALVALSPETNGLQELAVIDISQPLNPRLINEIPIDTTLLGGNMESITTRSDGLVQVAGDQNTVLLNPFSLAITNFPAGQMHPAIVETIVGAGTGTRSVGQGDGGVYAVANGGRGVIVETPPQLRFISFPTNGILVDASSLHRLPESAVTQMLLGMVSSSGGLAPAKVQAQPTLFLNSDLEPVPNPALHFHVLVTAPGGPVAGGNTIEVGLESLNPAGRPLSNLGRGFAPIRAISDQTQTAIDQVPRNCGAPIRSITAYRLSDNPKSFLYDLYLSKPFALITEAVSLSDLSRLKIDGGVEREILFSGARLRAFLDPSQPADAVITPFVAQVDTSRKTLFPIATASAFTLNRDYVVGNNPPPAGASSPMEDTFGTIQAHSGELRVPDIDLVLPSPHMQITVARVIGNQDNYEGPFGVGWDFNYNQRLTVLDPLTFPAGLQMPLVVRDNPADSEIAGSQDVLFNNGEGQVYHFRWVDTNMPPGYVQDPLVQQFDYKDLVSDYYLPERGSFDLLVKYKDQRFERLTPDGMRFRYSPQGRLEMIIDRFAQNHHDLQYDHNNWLVRIDDASVSAPRFVRFGYFRRQATDQDFDGTIDTDTANSALEGKICRLVDYTGRDTIYQYSDDGFLTNRFGVKVDGENGGYAGRSHTCYVYTDCALSSVLVTEKGSPLVSAVTSPGTGGKPVTTATTGSHGTDLISVPLNNAAQTLGQEVTSVTMGDGSKIERHFDALGYVTSTKVTGTNGGAASEIVSNTVDGLPYYVLHPEGNSETTAYDTANPIFRSRGNVKSITVNPGPRGGPAYIESFQYDARCNLPSGDHVNADGFHINYALNSDGTAVQKITYGSAGARIFTYNGNGQLVDKVDENGVESSISYDSSTGFVTTQSRGGPGGIVVTYSYDGSIPSQLGKAPSIAQASGQPTTLRYNNLLQAVEVDRGALVTTTAYDELGRGITHREQVGDGEQWATSLQYNDLGFLTNAVMSGIEVNGQASSVAYNYTPDDRMRVAQVQYSNGETQTFGYDDRGNRISSTLGGYTEEFTYDLNNNPTSEKQGGDLIAKWSYDGLNRPTNVTYMSGSKAYSFDTSYYKGGALNSYSVTDPDYGLVKSETVDQIDDFGRPLTVTQHGTTISPQFQYQHGLLTSSVIGPRMTATTTWDSAGNRSGATAPFVSVSIKRDNNARVFQTDEVEDGTSFSHFYSYDDLDHQTGLSDLVGQMFKYIPRADGNEDGITDGRGNTTSLTHGSLGEVLQRQRADGMVTVYKHDSERRLIYEGDPGAGFNFSYDEGFRLTNSTLRGGPSITFSQFDPRRMPQNIGLPGGGVQTVAYDQLTRVLQRKASYQSTAWEEDFSYDALDRERVETYAQNGGPNNTTTYDYDLAGPLLAAHYHEDSADFSVTNTYYPDASRQSVIYPSGITVNETRDIATRLTGVSDPNGSIVTAVSWAGSLLPKQVQIGSAMQQDNLYDQRGRLRASRVTRRSDGAVLTHMRYEFDSANNLTARQFLHRGGRADVFGFDSGERLVQEQVGMIPTNALAGPILYQRNYSYHASGLDYLTQAKLSGPWDRPPPFATNWSGHDQFLLPGFVDAFSRSSDPMGNVAQAQLWVRADGAVSAQPVKATLQYDGMRHLVSVTRVDGVSVVNQYQPSGLRFSRKVFQGAQLLSYSAYVYDDSARLIEEYDRSGAQPVLVARYYYASGDSPGAADLYDQTSHALKRYYLLRDDSQSVIAIADASGTVVERIWYDAFGQPQIEGRDTQGPTLQSVVAGTNNSLLVVLSEPVLAPTTDPGLGSGIVTIPALSVSNWLSISVNSTNVAGSAVLLSAYPGFAPYSVIQFTPTQPLAQSNQVSVALAANQAADEWGNLNPPAGATFGVTNGVPGTVYYAASAGLNTAPTSLARSAVGCSFLFHGQYFDYDTGLLYLRSRFYDPFSGMFLQPDPLGYEQSVNHYAAFNNNPASVRDPTGLVGSQHEITVVRNGSQGRERYDRVAINTEGVSREVLTARNSYEGEGLVREAIGDHNQTGLIAALRELFPATGDNTVEIALKHQNEKGSIFSRYFANEGWAQKAEWIVQKSNLGKILTRKGRYAPDVDGLWIKVNGELLDYQQTKAVCDRANQISENLAKSFQQAGQSGEKGYAKMWEKVSNMFKHGFSANLMEEIGLAHYHGEGETRGKAWLEQELQAKVKKIPDGFTITLKGTYSDFTLDSVKNVSKEEVASVFKEKLQIFHDKLDPKNIDHPDQKRRFDQDLYNRVMSELFKGDFDIDHFPIGNGQIGLQ